MKKPKTTRWARRVRHAQHKPRQAVTRTPLPAALLQPRTHTMAQLRRSLTTIIRMERAGKLTAIRQTDSPSAMVYHRVSQVRTLAGEPAE